MDDEVRLASYFDRIYQHLIENGVPEDRIPSPWHVLSHVVDCLDLEKLSEWLDSYISNEAEGETSVENAPETPPRKQVKHRPSYLRPINDVLDKSTD